MLIFKCFLFLNILYYTISTNLIKYALNALQNNKKYFVIMEESYYRPVTKSSYFLVMGLTRIYTKVPNITPVLRIIYGTNINSYLYFINMESGEGSVVDQKNKLSRNFRSILLDDWNNLKPTNMNVTVRDHTDLVVAWLYFKVNGNDNLISWFSKYNLKYSFPWKIKDLLNYEYNYFSILGIRNNNEQRSFYINNIFNGCPGDVGVLGVFDGKDTCQYVKMSIFPQIMFAVSSSGQPGYWQTNGKIGKSLEIMATYNSSANIYA